MTPASKRQAKLDAEVGRNSLFVRGLDPAQIALHFQRKCKAYLWIRSIILMKEAHFELYLIRHGQTIATEKNLYCGNSDLPLSRKGRKELIKNRELYPNCQGYFSSGMIRCNETLELICGNTLLPEEYTVLPFLREMNLGAFDMKSHNDLKNRPEYIRWVNDKTGDLAPPGGEPRNTFNARVNMGLLGLTERIMRADLRNAMCITHGEVISLIINNLCAKFAKPKTSANLRPRPGAGFKLFHCGEDGYSDFENFP